MQQSVQTGTTRMSIAKHLAPLLEVFLLLLAATEPAPAQNAQTEKSPDSEFPGRLVF